MDIIISNNSDKPIYEQISSQLKGLILSGELKEGDALPSIRLIAKELKVSVITTKRAYSDLESEGFIETVAGKGSFVATRNIELIKEEQLKLTEELLIKAVEIAKTSRIDINKLKEMLTIIYEEE